MLFIKKKKKSDLPVNANFLVETCTDFSTPDFSIALVLVFGYQRSL